MESSANQDFGECSAPVDDTLHPAKKLKMDDGDSIAADKLAADRPAGVAPIKPEFLVVAAGQKVLPPHFPVSQDDRSEDAGKQAKRPKHKGQNTSRTFGSSRDALSLCMSRVHAPEFSPHACNFGVKCKYEHDLRKYLSDGKRDDLHTFNDVCPVWLVRGTCNAGWRCRFARSHSKEVTHDDGRKELVLIQSSGADAESKAISTLGGDGEGTVNIVSAQQKIDLHKRKYATPKADAFNEYLNKLTPKSTTNHKSSLTEESKDLNQNATERDDSILDNRAQYAEPPFRPSEKRRLYYGPETPILAPLTTQGNLPFRRLCVELGAQVTWSEMAMGLPLVQGEKSEWALLKAHEIEMRSPRYDGKNQAPVGYDNSRDFRFGAQIAANKPWIALKTTEILTQLAPKLRAIDLNCGCPIDLVYRQGAGSALLDSPAKLEKILRGMNAVSGEIPVTAKIRMGTKDDRPTADRLVERLALGGHEALEAGQGPCGVAAIALHGRSRQQRYTRRADWNYIAECAALIKKFNQKESELSDVVAVADNHDSPSQANGKLYFIGNGDCYSHIDYYDHIEQAKVDSVMVARGALIKPWIFEEIERGQYLDKSATERLSYVEKFARYGLEHWGSDEIGVGNTRRFLLEWLSFACRYVPIGLLEHLPPRIQDRPPAYRGRDELETLMASDNYKDWIKISEMFLGPAHENFRFEPKHKSSNAYDLSAEG